MFPWPAALGLAALAVGATNACSTASEAPAPGSTSRARALEAYRGRLEDVLLLTGEIEAAAAEKFVVPRTDTWVLTIRALVENGSRVKEGDRMVEFDNAAFLNRLSEGLLAVELAEYEQAKEQAAGAADRAQKQLELERARILLEKARLDAGIDEAMLPSKVYEENQLALRRAADAFERAKDELEMHDKSHRLELKVRSIELEKQRRELESTREALTKLVLRAPRDGLAIVHHNWREGRSYQIGDTAHPGQVVVSLPDLGKMRVRARMNDVDDGSVQVGTKARSVLDAFPDIVYEGNIESVSPVARQRGGESAQQFFAVTLALDRTEPERMRPGMSVRVEVVRRSIEKALLAPRTALAFDTVRAQARSVGGAVVPVKIGWCNHEACVIEGGLEAGTKLAAFELVPNGRP